jgi:hypothetical protein
VPLTTIDLIDHGTSQQLSAHAPEHQTLLHIFVERLAWFFLFYLGNSTVRRDRAEKKMKT